LNETIAWKLAICAEREQIRVNWLNIECFVCFWTGSEVHFADVGERNSDVFIASECELLGSFQRIEASQSHCFWFLFKKNGIDETGGSNDFIASECWITRLFSTN
jgi:hypothetical protein